MYYIVIMCHVTACMYLFISSFLIKFTVAIASSNSVCLIIAATSYLYDSYY